MSLLYIFGKDTSITFKRHEKKNKEIMNDVNETDKRSLGSKAYHFRNL